MQKTCKGCSQSFDIADDDLRFYDKASPLIGSAKLLVPSPTLCPECRRQRRLSFRNERKLYRRLCDLCQRSIIAAFPTKSPFPIYCHDCWWGDGWGPLNYGQPFNFSKSFFEQMRLLQARVPRLAVMNKASENSEYCNYAAFNRGCYLAGGGSWYNEDCLYGTKFAHSKDSLDCYCLQKSELCCEVTWGGSLYGCTFCADCFDSSDCHFSSNLRGCASCLLCTNLRNKQYYIRNQPSTREQYESLRRSMGSYKVVHELWGEFLALRRTRICPSSLNINCENCTGDYLSNCKNVFKSFEPVGVEDAKYLWRCEEAKDLMDCCATGYNGTQLCYELVNAGDGGERNLFSFNCWACSDVLYCDTPQSSHNCFGCVSLKRKEYCILNQEYQREEYEELIPKIVAHMRKTNEYGEFFPTGLSPFAYNETVAHEEFPLSKEEVLGRGWKWRDEEEEILNVTKKFNAEELPDSITDIPDDILNWAICCEATGRPFKIIKQELAFYRKTGLPIPHLHPDERHRRRMTLRNPRKLWNRNCAKCHKPIATSYAPDRPEVVYCEECYLATVY